MEIQTPEIKLSNVLFSFHIKICIVYHRLGDMIRIMDSHISALFTYEIIIIIINNASLINLVTYFTPFVRNHWASSTAKLISLHCDLELSGFKFYMRTNPRSTFTYV